MRILVAVRVQRTDLAAGLALDRWFGHVGALTPAAAVFLFDCPNDESAHRRAGLSGLVTESLVQAFRDVYGRSDRHACIMASVT